MDWNAAIEKNRDALRRVLATLVAMAGLGSPALTLSRRLHNAVLRLLRPAEAAVRRLVIVAARELVEELPARQKSRPKPIAIELILRSLGLAVVSSPAEIAARAAADRLAAARATRSRSVPARLAFPLFDPLRHPFRRRCRTVPARAVPRILFFDGSRPALLPSPASPNDPIDATRLGLRLQALGRVLDDLPVQARRFARWKARRDAAGAQMREQRDAAGAQGMNPNAQGTKLRRRRVWPLKPGDPPGLPRRATRLRPFHEVHDILRTTHGLAFWALERRDTS